jgi:hypothetical protein
LYFGNFIRFFRVEFKIDGQEKRGTVNFGLNDQGVTVDIDLPPFYNVSMPGIELFATF